MKEKFVLIISKILIIVIIYFSINSCKDNSVEQIQLNYIYDSPRYEWKVTALPGGETVYTIWSPDTSEVFMAGTYDYLLHFKNGQMSHINYMNNLKIFNVDGLNKNEVYVVGVEIINGIYKPHIEKWNGNSLMNVPLNYSFTNDFYVSHILVKSSNEIWISSPKGLIYKFDGYNLIQYILPDTSLISRNIINYVNNRIRYIAMDFDSIITNDKHYVYEFDGYSWSKVHENKGAFYYGTLNNVIYAYNYPDIIYKVENDMLTQGVYTPGDAGIISIAGNSFENIMCFGYTGGRSTFFHWNGKKWSDENIGEYFNSEFQTRKMINDDYFCITNLSSLYRAFKKH